MSNIVTEPAKPTGVIPSSLTVIPFIEPAGIRTKRNRSVEINLSWVQPHSNL